MADHDHLKMLYPEIVDRSMRTQEPVTEVRESGEYGRIYSAVQYDPETEIAWRADIVADLHPDYETTPKVKFAKCRPTARQEWLQTWSSRATGSLSGPQELDPWETLFTAFNAALDLYNQEGREGIES